MKYTKKATSDASLTKSIHDNIAEIKRVMGNSSDLIVRLSKTVNKTDFTYACIYMSELVNENSINNLSLSLIEINKKVDINTPDDYFDTLMNKLASAKNVAEDLYYEMLYEYLLSGYTIFLVDGCDRFFAVDTYGVESRSVEEPNTQTVIRGPKEGFTERININIALVRKRIKNKNLILQDLSIRSISKTRVSLMYIENIAKEEIVDEVKTRLNKIEIDTILDSSYIEELIKDDRYSIFPTFLNSEKPDSIAAALLEGRIAIFVDGTSFVLTAPALFIEFFQASEDYYHNFFVSSMMRIMRFMAFFLTLTVPSAYVSLVTFHQETIPTPLLISLTAQREDIPFPALLEAFLMEIIFEILREAGIRMPRAIGPAISIVGALVLGQAAVEAGIISAVMVIVVSLTAISSFAISNYAMSNAVRLIRFILMLMAGILGLYGVFMGLIVMCLHLCKLKSIGVPYLTPLAPKIKGSNKDVFFRFPLWKMNLRPSYISSSKEPRVSQESIVTGNEKEKREIR